MEEQINICFITDENYVIGTTVAIKSILLNRNKARTYYVYIIGVNLSNSSKNIFYNLNDDKFYIKIIDEIDDLQKNTFEKRNLHVTTAAIYKFMLPTILKDLKKVLYLDGDVIVQKNIDLLYDVDINNFYAACVKDLKSMTYNPPQLIKLSLSHSAYFNSGVMLLNLEKMREHNITEKLLIYRKNGINYFMDQDAFNVIFEEKVLYLPFFYNVITSVLEYFNIESINNYYGLIESDKKNIVKKSCIIHYASPYKPWDYNNLLCVDIWDKYYRECFKKELYRKNIIASKEENISKDFQKNKSDWNIKLPIIISLTTIKRRINIVDNVVNALLNQTVKVDKILLFLGIEDYPEKENNLPQKLLNLLGDRFEICWRNDIGPHTKYYYAMKEYPDSIIITVDDDINYPINLVEILLNSYVKYPYAISARRAHLIKFDKEGKLLPYRQWKGSYSGVDEVSLALFATGVGGVLYPPHCMHEELFNKKSIKELCFKADDLWLKLMQLMHNTPVVLASAKCDLNFIGCTQEYGLCNSNVSEGGNDIQLKRLFEEYNNFYGDNDTLIDRIKFSSINYQKVFNKKGCKLNNDFNYIQLKKQLDEIKKSRTYKVGKIIVWLPKKIRNGVRCYKEHGLKYTLYRIKQKALNLLK